MQPPTIYKPGKLGYLWNYLGSSLKSFAAALSPYMGGGDVGYKKYVALLTQTGIDPPVATVLENTLGQDIVWNRLTDGIYRGTFSLTFPNNKSIGFISNAFPSNSYFSIVVGEPYQPNDIVDVRSFSFTPGGGFITNADDLLQRTPIEIRVYP